MEEHLQQQVTEFFLQLDLVAGLDGVEQFVDLLEQVAPQ